MSQRALALILIWLFGLLLAITLLTQWASAQQTTIYGKDGRAAARVNTTRSGTTVYDAKTGNVTAKIPERRHVPAK